MFRRTLGLTISWGLAGGVAATLTAYSATTGPEATLSPAVYSRGELAQAKGRYKLQGKNCEWDATDGGPNQCEPIVKGRFKKGPNDACTWDASEVGADQCRPAKGRWKKGGDNSCTWDANDGGPDQCNPRQAK